MILMNIKLPKFEYLSRIITELGTILSFNMT